MYTCVCNTNNAHVFIYVCVHLHISTHTHIHTHTHTHIQGALSPHSLMLFGHADGGGGANPDMVPFTTPHYTTIILPLYVSVCLSVCVCLCVCVYIHLFVCTPHHSTLYHTTPHHVSLHPSWSVRVACKTATGSTPKSTCRPLKPRSTPFMPLHAPPLSLCGTESCTWRHTGAPIPQNRG
jgi:hypothetical protein